MKKLSECHILIVDDEEINLSILVEGLKSEYKINVAKNGENALRIARRNPPDLVLLDIMMPGMDGYEVCRQIRQIPELTEIPIMFLSSREELESKVIGFEAGANDYLTKPFEMLEVKARVHSLLKVKAYNDAVKEQIASELKIAREIQMGMLPHDFSGLEKTYNVELEGILQPAREVGGDLYGVCGVEKDRLVIYIGDVSGKGIPASLFMVRAVSLALLLSREIIEPEQILYRLNNELSVDNPSYMFVTFLCAVYIPSTRTLTIANGGQCRPLLLRRGETPRPAVSNLGTALGIEQGIKFNQTELTLNPGDTIIFYTDGVTEALNQEEECYGDKRILEDTERLIGKSVSEITAGLLAKVHEFAGKASQSDDIAILTLHIKENS